MKPLCFCLLLFLCTTAMAAQSLPLALDERRLLPVVTHSMTPGSVSPRALFLPGMTPLFLVGDDPHSRRWLIDNRQRLVRLHAADWMNRVLGEQTINLSAETTEQQSGAQAGVGLHPLIHEEQEKIRPLLSALVNGEMKPTFANLAQVSGGSLMLSRGVVEALRDDPDASLLIERLSGELALSRVTEQALLARRVLLAGRREPNIATQKEAQTWLNEAGIQLDQELSQIKLEMDMRHALADNAASLTLQRRTTRNQLQGQATQTPDNSDQRIRTLNQPQPDAAP